ncbi:hypothetical protein [Actinomadura rupiterrae]|uniref:hypothetical protein n=1 Tax=Actinomadura rupiterrae TaxID=559627 RepID=UPI0020A2C481|nr:hypothetical protein [Actinomadura rupiterrae]MCP2339156.1 hypothetical protein [Actinomadura rupiterrae]
MADEPGLGELSRKIEDFRRDVRDDFQAIATQLAQYVLREVYLANEAAQDTRIARLERELENARNTARTAIYAAIGAAVSSVVAAVIITYLFKGGH